MRILSLLSNAVKYTPKFTKSNLFWLSFMLQVSRETEALGESKNYILLLYFASVIHRERLGKSTKFRLWENLVRFLTF